MKRKKLIRTNLNLREDQRGWLRFIAYKEDKTMSLILREMLDFLKITVQYKRKFIENEKPSS